MLPDPGHVDEGVQGTHPLLGLGDQVGQPVQLSQIGHDGVATGRRRRLLDVDPADARSRIRQPGGGGAADPVGRTRHEHSSPLAHQLPSSSARCSAAASNSGPWPHGTSAPSGTFA